MRDLGTFLANPLFRRLGWALAAFLWQGTLVAVLLACVNALTRRRGAGVRYTAACGALLLMAAIPVATFLREDPAARERVAGAAVKDTSLADSSTHPGAPVETPAAAMLTRAWRAGASSATPWLVSVWILGVLILSLRFLAGCAGIRTLSRRRVADAPAAMKTVLARAAKKLRISRAVRLLQSSAVAVPTALGVFRPAILLPVSAVTGLSAEALEAVLAHELAHIRRHDYLVNLFQTAVETLLFYHPAVWWVSRRIRIERENCCDDIAVAATGNARTYARALLGLEEIRRGEPRLAVAANGGALWNRVHRLVAAPGAPADRTSGWTAAVLALVTIGTLGAAARISDFAKASTDGSDLGGASTEKSAFQSAARPTRRAAVAGGVRAGVAGGVSGGIAGGVTGGVAGGVAGGAGDRVDDPGEDTSMEPASKEDRARRGLPSPEDLTRLKRHGITPEFLGSLAALGYKRASVDDLLSVKIHGVAPEYIAAMNEALGPLSLDELVQLKIHGVTPEFVRGFREAGHSRISAEEALSLRIHGVSPEMAAEWTKLLARRPEPDEVVSARIHGVTPDFAREMRSLGLETDLDALVSLRIHGVTPEYVRAMKSLGYSRLSSDEAVSSRIHGVTPDFVRDVQSLGYRNVSLDELTSLRIHGVTPEFIREANRSAASRLPVDDLLDLRIHRRIR